MEGVRRGGIKQSRNQQRQVVWGDIIKVIIIKAIEPKYLSVTN